MPLNKETKQYSQDIAPYDFFFFPKLKFIYMIKFVDEARIKRNTTVKKMSFRGVSTNKIPAGISVLDFRRDYFIEN